MSSLGWIVDPQSIDLDQGHQIDWDALDDSYRAGVQPVQTNGAALAAATSVTVDPLTVAIPAGTVLMFADTKPARVNTAAAVGATTLAVDALVVAIADNDVAQYFAAGAVKVLKSGTPMGVDATTRKMRPRVVTTYPAVGLLVGSHRSDDKVAAQTGAGLCVGGVVYENALPGATGTPPTIAAGIKTELGSRFVFRQYVDSTNV